MACVLSQSYARFDGDGKVINDNTDEVESFISLGIDTTGNEYFVVYPDTLIVLSMSEQIGIFKDGKIQALQDAVTR